LDCTIGFSYLGYFPFSTAIMKKFTLELFTTIIGIGSASGLFFQDHFLYLISDNSGFLYEYNITDTNLNKYPPLKPESKHSKKGQT
jgi:predicted RND superfamily exporter protein